MLQVHIKTNTALDSAILKLLEAYEITLPLSAPNAKIASDLYIGLNLDTLDLTAKGIFKSKDIEVLLQKTPLISDSLNLQLDNHLIKVESKNTSYQDLLKSDSNFVIDTQAKTISGDLLITSLLLSKESPEVLQITNQSLPFNVNFAQKQKNCFCVTNF